MRTHRTFELPQLERCQKFDGRKGRFSYKSTIKYAENFSTTSRLILFLTWSLSTIPLIFLHSEHLVSTRECIKWKVAVSSKQI